MTPILDDRTMVSIVVMAPSFPPAFRGGGPARTLDALTRAAPPRFDVKVFAPDRDSGVAERMPVVRNAWSRRDCVDVYYGSVDSLRMAWRLYSEVRRVRPHAIYLNSLFNLKFSIIPRVLAATGCLGRTRVLIAPRGELDAGALRLRNRKKRIFLAAYRALGLARNVIWHASSVAEAQAIRAVWGVRSTVLVRENETLLPVRAHDPVAHDGALRAVFISRLSRKKGLLTALEALSGISEAVEFDVYGPEEDAAYVAACRAAAARVGHRVTVRFCGEVAPDRVRHVLSAYDVMLFPTAGENFGHVIAESLSAACPVVTTDTTPWTALLRQGAGAVVDSQMASAWRGMVRELAALSPAERLERRRAAGAGYQRWRLRAREHHIFDLLASHVGWR